MKNAYTIIPLLLVLAACAQPGAQRVAEPMVMPAIASSEPAQAISAPADDATPGVGYVGPGIEPGAGQPVARQVDPYAPVRIRVVGTGAMPLSRSLSLSQKKLLSLRAARLDAFRAIAEQVQGMKLVGNSSVAKMVAVDDSFRTYVDAYLRGVNIVSSSIRPDGSSEVVAEIVLDHDFYLQFKNALQQSDSMSTAAKQTGAQGVLCGAGCSAPETQAVPPATVVVPAAPAAVPAQTGNDAGHYNSNFYNAQ
jgi:hypothetical protein